MESEPQHEPGWARRVAIWLLAGMNLTLVQYLAMKKFPTLVGSNELAVS